MKITESNCLTRANENVIEGIIQMSLEYWQAWGINHHARKPVPVFVYPQDKYFLPNVLSEPLLVQLCAVPMRSIIGYQGGETVTSLFISPLQEAARSELAP